MAARRRRHRRRDRATYTLGNADVGHASAVVASYTDGHGTAESVTSGRHRRRRPTSTTRRPAASRSRHAPKDQTLTAANTLADADGLGAISYQWQRDGVDIAGATGATYTSATPTSASMLRVVASYTDGHGTAESVTSRRPAAVTNVNDAPTGSVTISGTAPKNQTLTAANTLADADGLGAISYQWQRDGVNVGGAPGPPIRSAMPMSVLPRVVASYTDGHGTAESKTSAILFVPFPGEIFGDANNNTLTGTNGNDVFQGFGGNDTINGGLGNDRSVYTDATGSITVDLAAGTVTGLGVGTDTLIGIEQIQGSNFADHYSAAGFTGVSGVPGTPAGFNSFEGMGGDDVIVGAVNIQGQMLTRISYASATAAVTVDIAADTATGNASVGTDSFVNVNAVVGSAFNDVLRGSDNPNGTYEQYEGRAGDDLIDGRGGYDFAVYNNDPTTTSGITVNLAAGTVAAINPLDLSIGADTLRSVEAVRGTNFNDTYNALGFSGASTNAGSLGTFNNFDGVGGNDTIIGNGNTRIQYSNALAAVTVDIALGTAQGTAAGDLSNTGTDSFTGVNSVMGSMFDDFLLGSANNETFMGLAGNDFIDGRGGFDTAQYNNMTYTHR